MDISNKGAPYPGLQRLAAATTLIQEATHRRVEATTVMAFLVVANQPGKSVNSLARAIGVTQSASTRIIDRLGNYETRSGVGYGLLEHVENPYDRRSKIVRLTPEGKELAARIDCAIRGVEREDINVLDTSADMDKQRTNNQESD